MHNDVVEDALDFAERHPGFIFGGIFMAMVAFIAFAVASAMMKPEAPMFEHRNDKEAGVCWAKTRGSDWHVVPCKEP